MSSVDCGPIMETYRLEIDDTELVVDVWGRANGLRTIFVEDVCHDDTVSEVAFFPVLKRVLESTYEHVRMPRPDENR